MTNKFWDHIILGNKKVVEMKMISVEKASWRSEKIQWAKSVIKTQNLKLAKLIQWCSMNKFIFCVDIFIFIVAQKPFLCVQLLKDALLTSVTRFLETDLDKKCTWKL